MEFLHIPRFWHFPHRLEVGNSTAKVHRKYVKFWVLDYLILFADALHTTHKMLEHCNPMRMYIYSKSMIYFSECVSFATHAIQGISSTLLLFFCQSVGEYLPKRFTHCLWHTLLSVLNPKIHALCD